MRKPRLGVGVQHAKAQTLRFSRLTVGGLLAQAAAFNGEHFGRSAIISVAIGGLEVAYRQFYPTVPAPQPEPTLPPGGVLSTPTPASGPVPPVAVAGDLTTTVVPPTSAIVMPAPYPGGKA